MEYTIPATGGECLKTNQRGVRSMNSGNKQNTKKQANVQATAAAVLKENNPLRQGRQFALWIAALILGGILGWMNIPFLNALFNFIATIFTRLFQFVAVPTIALAVITTLAALGSTPC